MLCIPTNDFCMPTIFSVAHSFAIVGTLYTACVGCHLQIIVFKKKSIGFFIFHFMIYNGTMITFACGHVA